MQSLELLRPCQPVDAEATVLASVDLTPTIKSIWLRLDQPMFRFLPGQSVWPRFERAGRTFSKIYSIASSPSQCPEVELCVSRVGWSSATLQDLPPGDTIALRGPYGLMTLKEVPLRPRIYLAEGSGIAPLKSQIDWLLEAGFHHPIWLIQANPETPEVLPYWEHWRALAAMSSTNPALKRTPFHYVEAIAHPPESALSRLNLDLSQFDIEICAVNQRPHQLQQAVLALGAHPAQIRVEGYYAF